jgi:hypothetical protein
MRAPFALALMLALAAAPAAAQVQQNDPNAANASLARQSETRALQQQRVSDFNTLNMQAQRNVQYRPHAPAGGYVPRVRGGRRGHGGFNTGVCVGC